MDNSSGSASPPPPAPALAIWWPFARRNVLVVPFPYGTIILNSLGVALPA
jgi:hypothetical protein